MPRLPEEDEKPHPQGLLWPALREQIFHADALTKGGQRVQIGDYEYANVDMNIGPEDPRPFVELSSALGKDRIPWRAAIVVEGGGKAAMAMKEIAAGFLAMFPNNTDLRRAFAALEREREQNNHISVKMRASFATWAPVEEGKRAAPPHLDPEPARRGLGQLQGHLCLRRSPGRGDEHRARP